MEDYDEEDRRAVRCCWSLVARAFNRTDREDELHAKRVFVPTMWFLLGVVGALLPLLLTDLANKVMFVGLTALTGCVCVSVLVAVYGLRRPVLPIAPTALLCFMVLAFGFDWLTASYLQPRSWTLIVIILDVTLVLRLHIGRIVIGVTMMWLFLERAESSFRLGMYEAAHDVAEGGTLPNCDCAQPPCGQPLTQAVMNTTVFVCVFLLDYYFTRGFAVSMRHQMALVSHSIATCDILTSHVSRYELEEARSVVDGDSGEQLPPKLRHSYSRLLENLETYRPYLPDSVLLNDVQAGEEPEWDGRASHPAVSRPPGDGHAEADVAICFTDIQSSTALWEANHQGMYTALQKHNTLLRRAAAAWAGYEVKTIGDAFMLTFHSPSDAVAFAMDGQMRLVTAEWPSDLMRNPLCCKVETSGEVVWNGLRVRMGVHSGIVRIERNPITNRCDYFGPAANTAARIEAYLKHGGLIGVSAHVFANIQSSMTSLGDPFVYRLGMRDLKGIAEPVELLLLFPQQLRSRVDVLDSPITTTTSSSGLRRRSIPDSQTSSWTSASAPTCTRLALSLQKSSASCAHVKVSLMEFEPAVAVPVFVAAVDHSVDVTQGVLQSVLSSSCVVTWNAPRPCSGHTSHCAYFTSVVHAKVRQAEMVSHTGAASGKMLSGNVAGCRRRFATVIGGCAELANVLAGIAETLRANVLVVGPLVEHKPSAVRIGEIPVIGDSPYVVYSVASEDIDGSLVGVAPTASDVQSKAASADDVLRRPITQQWAVATVARRVDLCDSCSATVPILDTLSFSESSLRRALT
eukprot:TRINITY_DN16049_c0_g1_i2.p1 TRINITY_DN16049_c0_g1~~TRINITY_DN16049_c0_g1_i2.p1  ORF type:complete len:800 (+),score=189.29 TRINITY_DN16049_c0_g1_i2:80-2479(+)